MEVLKDCLNLELGGSFEKQTKVIVSDGFIGNTPGGKTEITLIQVTEGSIVDTSD